MIDQEKVIKALEVCIPLDEDENCPTECPYYQDICSGYSQVMRDALELLKEKEPKQIVRKQGKRENSDGSIEFFAEWHCPHCGMVINRGFETPWVEFCYMCGQALQWEVEMAQEGLVKRE